MALAVEALSATDGAAVTPSDSTIVNFDALYVGGAGNVVVKTIKGTQLTFASVPAGTILPVKGTHVMAATAASDIVALRY